MPAWNLSKTTCGLPRDLQIEDQALTWCRKRVEKQIKDTQEKIDKLRAEVSGHVRVEVEVERTNCQPAHASTGCSESTRSDRTGCPATDCGMKVIYH